jgi:hypothetical protein
MKIWAMFYVQARWRSSLLLIRWQLPSPRKFKLKLSTKPRFGSASTAQRGAPRPVTPHFPIRESRTSTNRAYFRGGAA